jgi:hypothetical protein
VAKSPSHQVTQDCFLSGQTLMVFSKSGESFDNSAEDRTGWWCIQINVADAFEAFTKRGE